MLCPIYCSPIYCTIGCALPSIRFLFFCEKKYIIFACRPPPPLFAAPLPAFLAKAKRRRCSAPLFPRTGGAPFFTCRTSLWKSSSLPLPWRSFCSAQIYSARLCSAPAWPADFARCCFSSLFSFTIDRMVTKSKQKGPALKGVFCAPCGSSSLQYRWGYCCFVCRPNSSQNALFQGAKQSQAGKLPQMQGKDRSQYTDVLARALTPQMW